MEIELKLNRSWYAVEHASVELGKSPDAIRKLVQRKRIKCIKSNDKRIVIRREDLIEYIRENSNCLLNPAKSSHLTVASIAS